MPRTIESGEAVPFISRLALAADTAQFAATSPLRRATKLEIWQGRHIMNYSRFATAFAAEIRNEAASTGMTMSTFMTAIMPLER